MGGSQSGVTASIQAARAGKKVILVSKSNWLGGSMTEAGVSAIDGNEILALQTGLWGEFIKRLVEVNQDNLLHYGWVSLFTFNPQTGNHILQSWLAEEPNITWLTGFKPQKVIYDFNSKFRRVKGLELNNGQIIKAKITIDATENGDLLSLGKIPYRLGWEYKGHFQEPSAPITTNKLLKRYPLQELTWVFFMKDYGAKHKAPTITKPIGYTYQKAAERYWCAFKNPRLSQSNSFWLNLRRPSWRYRYKNKDHRFFSPQSFLTYGQVSPDLFMINWPQCGNDYSLGIKRIFTGSEKQKQRFYQEARTYSLWFAKYIQETFEGRFGLASEVFPARKENDFLAGFAYLPYNREVRRLEGRETLTEKKFNSSDG